jgi:hypothetical protein
MNKFKAVNKISINFPDKLPERYRNFLPDEDLKIMADMFYTNFNELEKQGVDLFPSVRNIRFKEVNDEQV